MTQAIYFTYLRLLKYKMEFRVNPKRDLIDYKRYDGVWGIFYDGVWGIFFHRSSKYCRASERILMDYWILPKDT